MSETVYSSTVGRLSNNIYQSVATDEENDSPLVERDQEVANKSICQNVYEQGVTRIANLLFIPFGAAAHAIDGAVGSLLGGASIVSLGLSPKINIASNKFFASQKNIVADAVAGLIRVVNPKASGFQDGEASVEQVLDGASTKLKEEGTVARKVEEFVHIADAMVTARSSNWVDRNLTTRAVYFVAIPAFIIARVADTCIGIIYAVGALFQGGKNSDTNQAAYKHLKLTAIAGDVVEYTRKLINPWSISEQANPFLSNQWFGYQSVNNREYERIDAS